LMALGLLGPVGPALVISVMIVALVTVHWSNGLFVATNGIEVPLLYAAASVALAIAGPGSYSVDGLLGINAIWTESLRAVALGFGVVGGVANLAIRRPVAVNVN